MSTVKLTEERLRTWMCTDQPSRERMCLGILALDTRFINVKPRRPNGGPDGARDIEAIMQGEVVWGGVGFRNNVTDSSADKKWLKKKFTDDITNARNEYKNLKNFIFFTNIDLTPGDNDALIKLAQKKGYTFIDIFHRERLRIALDSPEGLGFRFQYLDIELSGAEQKAFFSKWGQGLESLILKNFSNIDRKLNKLEFLSQINRDIYSINFVVLLKQNYTASDLGNFKFLCEINNSTTKEDWQKLCLAGYSATTTEVNGAETTSLILIQQLAWFDNEEKLRYNCQTGWRKTTHKLSCALMSFRASPISIIKDLDNKYIYFYLSKNLVEKLNGVFLVANNFVIAGDNIANLVIEDAAPEWLKNHPKEFIEPFQDLELVISLKKVGEEGEFPRRTSYTIDIANVDYKVTNQSIDWLE